MLYAWCDESGHEQREDYMFLAGFLGNKEQWKNLKTRWAAMGGTPAFHTKEILRNPARAEPKLARLGPVPASCGLRPLVAGVRMDDYWDLVSGLEEEKRAKGWCTCLYPLVLESLLYVPKDESVEFGFDQQETYAYNAGLVFSAIMNYPDERLKNGRGLSKISSWRFVERGRTVFTQPADYLAYAWMAHFRDSASEEARLTRPILDCIADFEQIGAILSRDQVRHIISSMPSFR